MFKLDDPEISWKNAIHFWHKGWDRAIVSVIRRQIPPPPFAVDFLCDLATGKAKRAKGRPFKGFDSAKFSRDTLVMIDYFDLCDAGHTKESAFDLLTAKYHLSESAISQIVYPRGVNKTTG